MADGSGVGLLLFSFACPLGAKLPRLCKSHDREGGFGQDSASRVQQPSPSSLSTCLAAENSGILSRGSQPGFAYVFGERHGPDCEPPAR